MYGQRRHASALGWRGMCDEASAAGRCVHWVCAGTAENGAGRGRGKHDEGEQQRGKVGDGKKSTCGWVGEGKDKAKRGVEHGGGGCAHRAGSWTHACPHSGICQWSRGWALRDGVAPGVAVRTRVAVGSLMTVGRSSAPPRRVHFLLCVRGQQGCVEFDAARECNLGAREGVG